MDNNMEIQEKILWEMKNVARILHVPLKQDNVEFRDDLPENIGGFYADGKIMVANNKDYSFMLFNAIHELWHYSDDHKNKARSKSTEDHINDEDEVMADSFAYLYCLTYHKFNNPGYIMSQRLKYNADNGKRKKAIDKMSIRYGLIFFFNSLYFRIVEKIKYRI